MGADISRDTFVAIRRREGVLLQQGRPLSDADWNEQVAITRHRDQERARDTFGRAAAPRDGGGFTVTAVGGGRDLSLSSGRIYVDGLAVDNTPDAAPAIVASAAGLTLGLPEPDGRPLVVGDSVVVTTPTSTVLGVVATAVGAAVTLQAAHGVAIGTAVTVRRRTLLSRQPYAPAAPPVPTVDGSAPSPGRYVVVLHAHVQGFSVLDDPTLAEQALGGPDTATREGVVWRVGLARVGAVGSGTCTNWDPPTPTARLRPSLAAPTATGDECALPADAGYLGVRNSLYRIQVAQTAADGTVTRVLWDPDNGSVAAPVAAVSASTVTLASFGPRGADPFEGAVVTAEDEATGWTEQPARVATVTSVDRDLREVLLSAPWGPVGRRPRLRRWSGVADVPGDGSPVELEQGLYVTVSGRAPVGAYWLVTARSALSGSGSLEWPGGGTEPFAALPHRGPPEAWAALALVDFDGTRFTVVPDLCRTEVPSLSTITAGDVSYDNTTVDLAADTVQDAIEDLAGRSGTCTVVLRPTDDWAATLRALPAGTHARLCFAAGEFTTSSRIELNGLGHLVVDGVGPGTRIQATHDEVALAFNNCTSVTVRDLAVLADHSPRPAGGDGLGGALTITGATIAVVERVLATCRGASLPLSACISVAGTGGSLTLADQAGRFTGRAIVRDCSLAPGQYQVGLSVRDMEEVDVSGVVVSTPATGARSVAELSGTLRHRLRDLVIARAVESGAPGSTDIGKARFFSGSIREVRFPQVDAIFQTPTFLAAAWQATLVQHPRPATRSPRSFLLDVADDAVLVQAPARGARLRASLDAVLASRIPPSWQGIVVAGTQVRDVTVRDCRVSGAIQGIHLGASRSEGSRGPFISFERVTVTSNSVDVVVPVESAGERGGIFVGNATPPSSPTTPSV